MNATLERPNGTTLRTLVDELLAEQNSLTAVERFTRLHARHDAPAQEKFYRDLIPLTLPAPGQQYAFEVDLDKCSGCKACVTACHALNGLDDEETWRDVGLLYSDDWRAPFQVSVTTACHHCVDPGCLTGCPVLAYEKDEVTGIVRHLDDQCIGCQYCVMKCPYEVPQYSRKRGIVRKCDMCSSRLEHGEAPACVQACPSQAIRITLTDQREVTARFRESTQTTSNPFLAASPAPDCTVPTTRYTSARPLPAGLLTGDHARVSPANPHLPLVFMLVFSQLAVGAATAAVFLEPANWLALIATLSVMLALGVGTLHLGQPLKAWRAFLGWRTSWFSREVIAFGLFVPFMALAAISTWLPLSAGIQQWLLGAAAGIGLVGVACSAMVYVDTHREFWRWSQSFGKFFGTTLMLGSIVALLVSGSHSLLLIALASAGTVLKLALEQRIFRYLVDEETPAPVPLSKSARLLAGELGLAARARILCGLLGGLLLLLVSALGTHSTWMIPAALLTSVAGELLERYLFFAAAAPAKMPGAITA